MNCKICASLVHQFDRAKVLNKHEINYFQCSNCGFIQTEEPFWLTEAYSEAIASSDVGLVFRNGQLSQIASHIIPQIFDHNAKFLDYGAGYGLFVRLMRDLGFDFYWHDKFCQNIFAKGLEAKLSSNIDEKYELVTAFEVFEHFTNPLDEIEQILKYSRNILFSTDLLPENNPKPNEWWYYALQEGQHIAIYTSKALSIIADKYKLNFYSNGRSLHLLTERIISDFKGLLFSPISSIKKQSLLEQDYLKAIGKLVDTKIQGEATIIQESKSLSTATPVMTIAIDGVFFQLYKTGIARVWKTLLQEWAKNGFGKYLVVLDRANTAPKIPGIRYFSTPPYDLKTHAEDREMLEEICNQIGADLFISTYYTTPLTTPSVFMAYDMIPEVLGWDLRNPMWQVKHQGIKYGSKYITISENTARDLVKFFPEIPPENVTVALCGIADIFKPANVEEVNKFRIKYGISKPYFILVGAGGGYKNTIHFLRAFAQLATKQAFDIVCTGSGFATEQEWRSYTSGSGVYMLQLEDEELRLAYSGAIALVYPSKYEGFGLPVLEAIACGCPVITCTNASIPEVAGNAALYIDDSDVNQLAEALCDIQKPAIRQSLITAGLEQAQKFSWSTMAQIVSDVLVDATLQYLNLREINLIVFPDWSVPEEYLHSELGEIISCLTQYPDKNKITLLINTTNISEEEVNFFLSSTIMNLLIEENVDMEAGLEISLVGKLDPIQYSLLRSRLQSRIILNHQNDIEIVQSGIDVIPAFQITRFVANLAEKTIAVDLD
jgi:glycosyltransferase involved in cell wall biosynthesis